MPRKGTISTCRKFSTADPTVAPAASPPTVINAALPGYRTTESVDCVLNVHMKIGRRAALT